MRSITPVFTKKMRAFYGGIKSGNVAKRNAVPVQTFRELVYELAELSCLNRDYLLFYRGQAYDYRNKSGATSLYPSIYRGNQVPKEELDLRFSYLRTMASNLQNIIKNKYSDNKKMKELLLRKHVQWSILQHYEVCPTPFLDVTQSILVACSFAFLANTDKAFLYILGMPYNTNRISRNSEHEIINIRLLSICPPEALRPYFQEGYLVGTDGLDYRGVDKNEYDFNRRLMAKYELPNSQEFWTDGFSQLPHDTLYPLDDPIAEICNQIKQNASDSVSVELIGTFISMWSELESALRVISDYQGQRLAISEQLKILRDREILSSDEITEINHISQVRNRIVHAASPVSIEETLRAKDLLESILSLVKEWH